MTNIDYDKLHSQLIQAVANNKGPEAVPEMKNVINAYLSQFDDVIRHSVNNMIHVSNNDTAKLDNLSNRALKAINDRGVKELANLIKLIDNNLNQKRVNKIVQNTIKAHVAKVTRNAINQINQYFSALKVEEAKLAKVSSKTDDLSNRLDSANDRLDQSRKRTCYDIVITAIVTACVVWIFL